MSGGASEEDKELLATIKSMHEQNPMLGLRGCRLGLMIPDFVKVQTRAILNALIAVKASGGHPKAKIMIPLVGHVNELKATKDLLEAEAKAVEAAAGIDVEYVFGTMIEVPRGALTADEIAQHAAFFSFGTNDLTQMTFGYSRDDAEGGFLLKYVEDGILPVNPFQTLDDAVAGLMKTAVDKGRATRPDLELGICGEHGGDPRVDPQVRADRARLRVVLAVPRPGRPAGGGAGRPGQRRARQVASAAGMPDDLPAAAALGPGRPGDRRRRRSRPSRRHRRVAPCSRRGRLGGRGARARTCCRTCWRTLAAGRAGSSPRPAWHGTARSKSTRAGRAGPRPTARRCAPRRSG